MQLELRLLVARAQSRARSRSLGCASVCGVVSDTLWQAYGTRQLTPVLHAKLQASELHTACKAALWLLLCLGTLHTARVQVV